MSDLMKGIAVNSLLLVPGLVIIAFSFTVVTLTGDYSPVFLWGIGAGGIYCGLLWLGPILFPGKIRDERVMALHQKAVLIAYSVCWICFVSVGIALCIYQGLNDSIPIAAFVTLIFGWPAVFILVLTIIALAQHGFQRNGE